MRLLLEVEYLTGACRASRDPADTAPDWPPQPDRVFSALVSAWAARGESQEERAALEWLEGVAPPKIYAGGHSSRTAPDFFVPPNDIKRSSNAKAYLRIVPEHRARQPRRFPVAWLEDPILTMSWADQPEPGVLDALDSIARDVAYLGHSSSLVRCRFRVGEPASEHPPKEASRRVYPGRLSELESAYPSVRPGPGASVFADEPRTVSTDQSDWLVLEHVGGDMPDIRACALVGRTLRQTLMSGYRQAGLGDAIPAEVSGHSPDGKPTKQPHLAIVPMAFAGFEHADGRVFGFALVPPARISLRDIPGLTKAFNAVAPYDKGEEGRILSVTMPGLARPVQLSPIGSRAGIKASLQTKRYLHKARKWASVTPIVLDRHLKGKGDLEIREIIARSCSNAGLPHPNPERIQAGKHSAIEGAPPAKPLAGEPRWARWRLPESLATRSLVHAVIDFEEDVEGPVLLGAGRFVGLGLCCGLPGDKEGA